MTTEPRLWAQPVYASSLVLDGIVLDKVPQEIRRTRIYGGSKTVRFHDGTGGVVTPYPATGGSQVPSRFEFSWEDQATTESHWETLERRMNLGQSVYFIPYHAETEAFVLPEATAGSAVTLIRQWAKTQYAPFDDATFPNVVELDGSDLTQVSGTPSAGEFAISGATVTLGDATTVGQRLYVSYYPAYKVAVLIGDEQFSGFNSVSRAVVLTELGD